MNKNNKTKLNARDNKNKKYKIITICNSLLYRKKLADDLPRLYYRVFQISYLEENNIWEFTLAI